MSIRVVCPNGHALKVKDELAGKTGLCPVCKARVQVPMLRAAAISEDAILDMMGPASATPTPRALPPMPTGPAAGKKESQSPPKKSCTKCNREILAAIHICPYCHTYIARPGDF